MPPTLAPGWLGGCHQGRADSEATKNKPIWITHMGKVLAETLQRSCLEIQP